MALISDMNNTNVYMSLWLRWIMELLISSCLITNTHNIYIGENVQQSLHLHHFNLIISIFKVFSLSNRPTSFHLICRFHHSLKMFELGSLWASICFVISWLANLPSLGHLSDSVRALSICVHLCTSPQCIPTFQTLSSSFLPSPWYLWNVFSPDAHM